MIKHIQGIDSPIWIDCQGQSHLQSPDCKWAIKKIDWEFYDLSKLMHGVILNWSQYNTMAAEMTTEWVVDNIFGKTVTLFIWALVDGNWDGNDSSYLMLFESQNDAVIFKMRWQSI